MRIWSIHPQYLDGKGLVALWREGLMAQSVLLGKTKGYQNHPQLERFKACDNPLVAISGYLRAVYEEACRRGYNFDRCKIVEHEVLNGLIPVSSGQIAYEMDHLKGKLKIRNSSWLREISRLKKIDPHPLFTVVERPVAEWERVPKPP